MLRRFDATTTASKGQNNIQAACSNLISGCRFNIYSNGLEIVQARIDTIKGKAERNLTNYIFQAMKHAAL